MKEISFYFYIPLQVANLFNLIHINQVQVHNEHGKVQLPD